MSIQILVGDALKRLREMPSESVHCCVTSPPYFGLRDYGCEGQIGLETTPAAYVGALAAVFGEVRRVLRPDGVAWVNLGDSYAANRTYQVPDGKYKDVGNSRAASVPDGLKPKDLLGIPWRVAFALQADGWWLRSEVIWSKPNPMPESVTDRPTKAHEYVFLLTRSERYFYDADAIREPFTSAEEHLRRKTLYAASGNGETSRGRGNGHNMLGSPENGRNRRSVWEITSQPFPEAHFATFPPELARLCILAGTSQEGACEACGAPWRRVTERTSTATPVCATTKKGRARESGAGIYRPNSRETGGVGGRTISKPLGWSPTCTCDAAVVPCTVLDPFAGSGTTLAVAQALGRSGVGIELNPDYAEIARRRVQKGEGLFTETPVEVVAREPAPVERSLFMDASPAAVPPAPK